MADMKISEIIDFMSDNRTHIQQGMFPDVQQAYLLQSNLMLDEVSLRALVGASLKPSEFLKLDQTCLADVILEEKGSEHLRIEEDTTPDAVKEPKTDQVCCTNTAAYHLLIYTAIIIRMIL